MSNSFLMRHLLPLWVNVNVLPTDSKRFEGLAGKKLCYVMHSDVDSKKAVLETVCHDLNLPLPSEGLEWNGGEEETAVFSLNRVKDNYYDPSPERLARLIKAVSLDQDDDILIVPVSVFWGRSPVKSDGFLSALFTDEGVTSTKISRFLSLLFNGRKTLIRYSEPVSLKDMLMTSNGQSSAFLTRKLTRVLRLHFARTRLATIGPDQPSVKTIAKGLAQQPLVQRAIEREVKVKKISPAQADKQVQAYAKEIAAVVNVRAIMVLAKLLSRLWNKLYDGIVLHHFERIERLSRECQIVYVPSHQSHMDYLVLSYILFEKGLATPHVAAGINLNIPIAGPWIRRCGAFFLRRSFKGNVLYGAVFEAYMGYLASKGTAVEYFVEGGRSRTGRRLKAKPGLLAMTVRSYLREHKRPVVFVPVNFAYEKLIEGDTYLNELTGKPKKTESVMGVLRSIKALKQHFGEVHVNFGEAISLDKMLDQKSEQWRQSDSSGQQEWVPTIVTQLGQDIMAGINKATHVNAVGLLAISLLSAPKQAMIEDELKSQLGFYLRLLKKVPYSKDVTVTTQSAEDIIVYGEKFGLIQRNLNALGDIISIDSHQARLMTYFRNNIIHLFALPSFLACCFLGNSNLQEKQLVHWFKRIYPFLKNELSMYWSPRQVNGVTAKFLECFIEEKLLVQQGDSVSLSSAGFMPMTNLSKGILMSIERYYLTLLVLKVNGAGQLSRGQLGKISGQAAGRLSLLYNINSPEFSEKSLFKGFIDKLFEEKIIWADDSGKLTFGAELLAIIDSAGLVLSLPIRRSVQQLIEE